MRGDVALRATGRFVRISRPLPGLTAFAQARRELKRLNPNLANITYDIQDLYNYIDRMPDMIALVLDPKVGGCT